MGKGIVCLGESLIDFIPLDGTNESFQKSPGGAPANVAVGCARLGAKSSFIGKVGNDVMGKYLIDVLNDYGVQTDYMHLDEDLRTGIVFVTLADNGERSFEFYINPSADSQLNVTEVEEFPYHEYDILHIGSISMINEPSKQATEASIKKAKENGLKISYDPNLRLELWENKIMAKETIMNTLSQTDILKLSDEELSFLTDEREILKGLKKLEKYNIPLTFITLGKDGIYIYLKDKGHEYIPSLDVQSIDTTGAGDAFVSGVLYQINQRGLSLDAISLKEAKNIAQYANISGGLAVSKKGAMTALPTLLEVEKQYKDIYGD